MIHLFSSITFAASSFPFAPLRLSPRRRIAHTRIVNKDTMNPSGPTSQNPSPLRLGPRQAPNQHSMRDILQFSLRSLHTLELRFCWEIQQTRNFIVEHLDHCQSDDTMADSGGYDNTVNYQAEFDEPEFDAESLSEDTELLHDSCNPTHCRHEATLPFLQVNQHVTKPSLEPPPSHFSQDSSLRGTPSFGYGHVEHPLQRAHFEEDGQPAAQSQPQYNVYRESTLPFLQGGQHATEPPSNQGQFTIIHLCLFRRLQCISRLIAPWHVQFQL
ncbi:hypothetical protein P692DRAFT_20521668 [Suillus brevipes Sb2]|nr:hypothetical protein P692DRAFT_20521668 [Suillus brevipes Sb2]